MMTCSGDGAPVLFAPAQLQGLLHSCRLGTSDKLLRRNRSLRLVRHTAACCDQPIFGQSKLPSVRCAGHRDDDPALVLLYFESKI
jgi:hypothetical protein